MKLEPNAPQKLRYSKQREQIYQYLLNTKEHPSADMIYKNLYNDIPNLSLGTVYRNLRLLVDLGMVQCVATTQNTERYDARCDAHAHFVCSECGAVSDLSSLDVDQLRSICDVSNKVNITSAKLVIEGVCEHCLE